MVTFENDAHIEQPEEEAKVEEEVKEEVVAAEAEEKPKKKRKARKKKPLSLEIFDRSLQPKEEKPEFSGRVLDIPDKKVEFPEGTSIVDAAMGVKMLRDTMYRSRSVSEKVAFLGRGKQKWFVLEMTSWRVVPGGILFVPVQMAGFSLLASWERLDESEAPDGFVAFRAQ